MLVTTSVKFDTRLSNSSQASVALDGSLLLLLPLCEPPGSRYVCRDFENTPFAETRAQADSNGLIARNNADWNSGGVFVSLHQTQVFFKKARVCQGAISSFAQLLHFSTQRLLSHRSHFLCCWHSKRRVRHGQGTLWLVRSCNMSRNLTSCSVHRQLHRLNAFGLFSVYIWGLLCTSIPVISGVFVARYLLKTEDCATQTKQSEKINEGKISKKKTGNRQPRVCTRVFKRISTAKKNYVNYHSAGWAVSILLDAEELGQDRLQKHLNRSHAHIATKQNFTASCGAHLFDRFATPKSLQTGSHSHYMTNARRQHCYQPRCTGSISSC